RRSSDLDGGPVDATAVVGDLDGERGVVGRRAEHDAVLDALAGAGALFGRLEPVRDDVSDHVNEIGPELLQGAHREAHAVRVHRDEELVLALPARERPELLLDPPKPQGRWLLLEPEQESADGGVALLLAHGGEHELELLAGDFDALFAPIARDGSRRRAHLIPGRKERLERSMHGVLLLFEERLLEAMSRLRQRLDLQHAGVSLEGMNGAQRLRVLGERILPNEADQRARLLEELQEAVAIAHDALENPDLFPLQRLRLARRELGGDV